MVPKPSSKAMAQPRPSALPQAGDTETRRWAHPGKLVGSVPTGARVI